MPLSASLKIHISPSDIVYLKFLLEGYDHLALPVVIDGKKAIIELLTYETEVDTLIRLLQSELLNLEVLYKNP